MHNSPSILVIFGITGDLAQRKLLPALYEVVREGLLPAHMHIVGVTRQTISVDEVLRGVCDHITEHEGTCDQAIIEQLSAMTELYQMSLTEDHDYVALLAYLHQLEDRYDEPVTRVYYLSIPPQIFMPVVRRLGETRHNRARRGEAGQVRLLVEKPFGYDLPSAMELIAAIGQYFKEDQIYRIDHYLAKETAQNILTFRFNNPIFASIWNARHIEHIQILASETLGIEGRTAFYEQTGALRDFVQSHLLQLLALTTMDRPQSLDGPGIHAAKLDLLNHVRPLAPDDIAAHAVRGQYTNYRQETGLPDSFIETYAALELHIDLPQWRGMPVFIRTGKQLAAKATEIVVWFKPDASGGARNRLIFRVQPNEGISLELQAKRPGYVHKTQAVDMDFAYHAAFTERQPDAYERVLVDALRGDRTLFATSEEVIRSWQIIQPVVEAWTRDGQGLMHYGPGSWGPAAAEQLVGRRGFTWQPPA